MLPSRHHVAGVLGLAFLWLLCRLAPSLPSATPEAASPDRPRLAVLLIFDQLRGDYLERWQDLFREGGFRRLMRDGAWFRNCHCAYSDTFTAPGHASIATGCSPDRHGIVGNDWYDRPSGAIVNCVVPGRYDTIPPRPGPPAKKPRGASPDFLLAPTLADALKEATRGRGRVVSLSLKDRGAVLPGGRAPDACYWFDTSSGVFQTSSYYRDAVHPWVAALNREAAADHLWGTSWERVRPDLDYQRYSGPDDVVGEGYATLPGRTFPHHLGGIPRAAGPSFYNAVFSSPFGNELLARLVRDAVEGEELGKRAAPDLLCVSFSSNDGVGHVWGPDSQEVLDITLRTDRLVEGLLKFLDQHVGQGKYTLALTADHGVCPLPEVSRAHGQPAWRPQMRQLKSGAENHLRETFGSTGQERWVEATAETWFWLDHRTLARHGVAPADAEAALAAFLLNQPGIGNALTRTELLGARKDDPVLAAARRSFYPPRSGDVVAIPKPYSVLWAGMTGTTHGTPHPYDTHVPLLVYGPGILPGEHQERVNPQAAAVVLAGALGIRPPARAAVAAPEGLFRQAGGAAAAPSARER
jgi:hypothetical protein